MVVCHCEALNDASIRSVIDDAPTVDEIRERCGAGGRCGGCLDAIRELVERHVSLT